MDKLLDRLRRVLRLVYHGSCIAMDECRRGQRIALVVLHVRWWCLQRDAAHNHVGRGYRCRSR